MKISFYGNYIRVNPIFKTSGLHKFHFNMKS